MATEYSFIQDDYTPYESAIKIYKQLSVGQNCTIEGFVPVDNELQKKGELVINLLREMWRNENTRTRKDIKTRPKTKPKRWRAPMSVIGGPPAAKMFKFKWSEVKEYKVTIYRLQ